MIQTTIYDFNQDEIDCTYEEKKMKTFDDLEFYKHEASISEEDKKELLKNGFPKDSAILKEMLHAKMEFENGKWISVVFGEAFYSNGIDTYEIMISERDEPIGYLSKEQVTKMMLELQK